LGRPRPRRVVTKLPSCRAGSMDGAAVGAAAQTGAQRSVVGLVRHYWVLTGYSGCSRNTVLVRQGFHGVVVWTCHTVSRRALHHLDWGVLTGYSTVLTRYSQRRSCPPSAAVQVKRTRPRSARTAAVWYRYALGCCASAAPTPVPTNVGDTHPPTYAPTLSPTFQGGERHAHSMPLNPLIAAGPAPWFQQYRARGDLHGAPAHSRATAALGTGCAALRLSVLHGSTPGTRWHSRVYIYIYI
jgi:hypothetical protein